MLRTAFLLIFRNFKRYQSSFLINLIGLSTGLASVLLIYLWVQDELAMDKFHEKDSQLYQVLEHVDQGTGMITRESTPGPMAASMTTEMPEVQKAVTLLYPGTTTLSVNNNDIKADLMYGSTDFFNLFTFPLLHGNPDQVLADKSSIVISASLARNLFGTTDQVVGKTIEVSHENQYQVSGVYEDFPDQSSMQFDLMLPLAVFWDNNDWIQEWGNTAPQTYLLMNEDVNVAQFNDKIKDLVREKTDGHDDHRTPFIARYSENYLHGHYENGVQTGGRIEYVQLFSVIAVFILLIACVNFMNLSTARSSRRAKEVGVKKTLGARRNSLVFQYLLESTLMVTLSLLVALILVTLFLPQFNLITEKQLSLEFSWPLLLMVLSVTLITGLLAGSYPAIYLSGFNPATVLKGKINNLTGEAWIRKGLVVFQFTLSIILIVAVWVVYQQISFVQNQNLGYQKDNILILDKEGNLSNPVKQESFLTQVKQLSGVINASGSGHDMTGHNGGTSGVSWPGKDPNDNTEFERVGVEYDLIETLGIEMKEGRSFSRDYGSDTFNIIFNQAAIDYMGLQNPVGQVVNLWGDEVEIIGVTENFHFDSFREEVKPLFMFLTQGAISYDMIKIEAGREKETIAQIQDLYQSVNPGFPFDYHFLDEDYQSLYQAEQRVSTLSRYFAGIAILISCLGLFGLAAFTAERRLKEIGIRKALGSSNTGIIYLLSKDFTKMVVISIVLALPISYLIAQRWLEGFAFRIELKWWFFAGAALVALFIAWFTVGLQTVKAARINPVKCLKDD